MNKIKTAGKWFGIILFGIILLALVVRTVLNIVFGVQLRNTIRHLKAQGRHITIDQIRPAPVPDSENAAVLLNQAFTLMTIGEGSKPYIPNQDGEENNKVVSKIESVKSLSDISKWTSEERIEIPKLVHSQDMQRIYGLIEEASHRPKCNFDLKYEKGSAMRLPNLAKIRSVSRLLAVKAMTEAQSGNLVGALDTLNAGLRVSNLFKDEPILISKLVMVACQSIMIDCLQRVTKSRDIPRDKAGLIIGELSKYTYVNFLDGEMALMGGRVLRGGYAYGLFSITDKRFIPHTFIKKVIIRTGAWFWTPLLKKDLVLYFSAVSQLEDDFKKPYYMTQERRYLLVFPGIA